MRDIQINVDKLIDLLECIQDATDDRTVIETIDEVITIVYDLAKEEENGVLE